MTLKYKTKGFVFKKSDASESDSFFSVFTKDFGRLDLRAKAIRKITSKLRSDIDIFYLSEVEFIQGKNVKTLTDARLIEKFRNLTQDLERFKVVNGIGNVLDNFIKGEEKDDAIFDLINEIFIKLNNYTPTPKTYTLIYYYFLWNFLYLLGYKPEVSKCNTCHEKLSPYNVYFSNKSGGIICKKCLNHDSDAKKINSDTVKILRLLLKKAWPIVSKLKIEPSSQKLFQEISDNYCLYTLSSHSFNNI
jgi:DNA repair protein RecO (recombination protein O)